MTPLLEVVWEPVGESGGTFGGFDALTAELSDRELLVRETVQNTWDARDENRPENTPVSYHLWGDLISGERLDALKHLVGSPSLPGFPGCVANIDRQDPAAMLRGAELPVVVVSDRWTVGLDGPTVGGQVISQGERTRFADFLRNHGRPTVAGGDSDGGAFGIGKTVLWRFSECSTVLVHTRTRVAAGIEERVLGKAIGPSFDIGTQRFTGRHFFGTRVEGELAAAITSQDPGFSMVRHELEKVGMPEYPDGACGTTVFIIGAALGSDSERTMEGLRMAIRWHAWPKYTPLEQLGDKPEMSFDLRWRGQPIPITPVDGDPEIAPYARALRAAMVDADASLHPRKGIDFHCQRPAQRLGGVRIEAVHAEGGRPAQKSAFDPMKDEEDPLAPVEGWGDNIAFVRRDPLLLVNYVAITAPAPDPDTQRCGVFLNDAEFRVNESLRTAEPPAHDRWVPERLPARSPGDNRRTFVKQIVSKLATYARTLGEEEKVEESRQTDMDVLGWAKQLLSGMPSLSRSAGLGPVVVERQVGQPQGTSARNQRRKAQIDVVSRDLDGSSIVYLLRVTPPDDQAGKSVTMIPQITVAAHDQTGTGKGLPISEVPGVTCVWEDDPASQGSSRLLRIKTPNRYSLDAEVYLEGDMH